MVWSRLIRPVPALCGVLFFLSMHAQPLQQQPPPAAGRGGGRGQVDAWAGKKKLLVIADPVEWYGASNYHHQAASHAMAVVSNSRRPRASIRSFLANLQFLSREK